MKVRVAACEGSHFFCVIGPKPPLSPQRGEVCVRLFLADDFSRGSNR